MTKRELIKALEHFDDDDEVYIQYKPKLISDYEVFSVTQHAEPFRVVIKSGNGTVKEWKELN